MKKLKLHSNGQKDHLVALMKKYDHLKNSLRRNSKLTEEQKQADLKKLNIQLKKEQQNSDQNLY